MNSSHSVAIDARRSSFGQIAYGVLFAVVLPALFVEWAMALDRQYEFPRVGSTLTGFALAVLGGLTIAAAIFELRWKGGGWPMSPYPPKRLVTTGVYAVLAHPIYAGCALLMSGLALIFESPAGVWLVTPVFVAMCIAWVWGGEQARTVKLFGRREKPFLHLPDPAAGAPSVSARISFYFLALLPWLLVYEGINALPPQAGAIAVATAWDARIPVIGWTEVVYFLVYPIVLLAPLIATTSGELRALTVRTWIATGGSALCYLAIPAVFEKKAVPATAFATMLEWERGFEAPNTHFPAFHVIWVVLVIDLYARAFPRWRWLVWPVVFAIAASCLTTGMHAIVDVMAGLILGLAFSRAETLWRGVVSAAERVSDSWTEWRVGPLRIMNHGFYAAGAVAAGILVAMALVGDRHSLEVALTAAGIIAGAALWAQWVEGSPALLRPFGYFGGLIGGLVTILVASSWSAGFVLLGAYAVAAPLAQAVGRVRCLVQGCCHGRPTEGIGIQVFHPRSRIVRMAGLSGVKIHATPVYSMVFNLVLGAILLRLWLAGAKLALISGAYLVLSGLGRFVEEHYRGEPQTRSMAGLRLYQWMSIASLIAGAALMAVPSAAAPPMESVSIRATLVALAFGALALFAYGVDFPESNRRFARLC